ncbi:hypothetical protein FA048_11080 [Pedobacter polaris]|uniref:DUF4468 domain-containing protein n=1 Tax=Pedobacter polaris TaxID=2571273 RepID=A0A4U1CRD6_9SPHI|nr:hypothetical protein [Pedobacter polaris]TKC10707.1 hypothetical protein FA048_11080 [Pedobacter polaris]
MKKLIFALLLFPIFSLAQVIPEKANQIIVVNNQTAYANFIDVKLLLAKKGIELASQDKDTFEVKSGSIMVDSLSKSYYTFTCRDDKIIITGINKSNSKASDADTKTAVKLETIANVGLKGSLTQLSFKAMNDFAKFLGTKLKYEVLK